MNLSDLIASFIFLKVEQPTTSGGKAVFHKKPLGRRWYLMSSSARSGAANLVPLRLERSESAASLEYCLAAASPFRDSLYTIFAQKQTRS